MKICEYVNNLLSLTLLTHTEGYLNPEFVENQTIHNHNIVNIIRNLVIFAIKVEQPRKTPLNESIISDAEFANKMIRKYGLIPMEIQIFARYIPEEILLLEIIRAINPDEINIHFGD
jgi:hypothetical protein